MTTLRKSLNMATTDLKLTVRVGVHLNVAREVQTYVPT